MYRKTGVPNSGRNSPGRPARAWVILNREKVSFSEFWVEQNGFSAADTFTLVLPFFVKDSTGSIVRDALGNSILVNGPRVSSALVNKDKILVEIYVGYVPASRIYGLSDLTRIMVGTMDTCDWSFTMQGGEQVTVHGRNAVGQMIDKKIVEKFPNLTSSAIATKFAVEHGLIPVVTPTTTLAGSYYDQNAAALAKITGQWEMLVYLARRENNFIVRVKDGKLYFGPYSAVTAADAAAEPLIYTWGYDIDELHIERSPHAARNIEVTVLSFDSFNKAPIRGHATSATQASQKIGGQLGARAKYEILRQYNGLTKQQAQNKAEEILAELSRTQFIGNVQTAGNEKATVDRRLTVEGVGNGLSRTYYINKVEHRFAPDGEGYTTDISLSTQTDYSQSEVANEEAPEAVTGLAPVSIAVATGINAGAQLLNPIQGTTRAKNNGAYRNDSGLDIRTPVGTPVYAARSGTIIYAEHGHTPWVSGNDTPNSILILTDHPTIGKGGYQYPLNWYTHLSRLAISVPDGSKGVHVKQGDLIGYSGTGNQVPHLHFGVVGNRQQTITMPPDEVANLLWP